MNILITGASGYIGSVLCKIAYEQGHGVTAVDIKNPEHNYFHTFVNSEVGDDVLLQFVKLNEIDTVFHLAASADVADSVVRPAHYFENNLGQTSRLIDNLNSIGWEGKFIFSSTAAVYGDGKGVPFKESDVLHPVNPYGDSKMACEELIENVCKTTGMKAIIFRYFNVVGANENIGDHLDSGHVIQKLCKAAMTGEQFKVFGHNLPTRDGTCIRDYVHVNDIALAHFHACKLLDDQDFGIYNLGTNNGVSVRELMNSFENITGQEVLFFNKEQRDGDPIFLVADPSKFINTGFEYKYSDMNTIITTAWESFKDRWK